MSNRNPLTEAETRDLRTLVGLMIPASAKYNAPGADDELIFTDILASLERDTADTRASLALLARMAGGSFADLPPARRSEVASAFKQEGGAPLFALNRVVLLCYYRDDRVMRSLGQEVRPPFPKGHEVEQGDWNLLEPVRQRAPLYRRVD